MPISLQRSRLLSMFCKGVTTEKLRHLTRRGETFRTMAARIENMELLAKTVASHDPLCPFPREVLVDLIALARAVVGRAP